MFNATQVSSCLSGLIGFKQHYNAGYDKYTDDLTGSLSGMFIDSSAHSLLTIENIAAIAENFSKTSVTAYAAGTTYGLGDIVVDSAIVYRSLQASNTAHTPASSAAWWKATNLLSAYLHRLRDSASINLFNAVFAKKKLYEVAKTLLTDTSLYDGVGSLSKKTAKLSRFVGFRIHPKYPDTVITIGSMGFQFDTANPTFKLYVYHSSQSAPLQEITIDVSSPISFTWKELTTALSLNFSSAVYNNGGYFYIGYYEDDLIGQAIWKEVGFSGAACGSCNGLSAYLHKQWGKYVNLQSIYVEEAWLNGDRTMWDEEKVIMLNNQNWGMNFKVQVSCDVSDLICRSKMAFADALRKQVVHDLIRDMAYSMRDNQKKGKVQQLAHYALENKENHTRGIIAELDEAVKNVSFDLSSINSVCLPCNSGGTGMIMSSVFS